MRRREKKPQKGSPKWMVTFSDIVLLVLVFFVMLFSMSVIDAKKFQAIADSFQDQAMFESFSSIAELENQNMDTDSSAGNANTAQEEEEINLDELLQEVQAYLEENDLNEYISATRDDRGVVLVLQEQLLFHTGEADILSEGEPFLNKVGTLLELLPNLVKVEGHTDNRPISTYRYPSNWELSGARASSVIRYLISRHDLEQNRFAATGYGATQPIAPNNSEENMQKNRRVVIVISDPAFEEETRESAR
ncbi:chemotaxis protein MotB [Alteribacillus persepolensis]|uniref:Chemotaxis protein MotB n=1 Tax=Alteribacillus persepolensis TaxID=568899 RepID=A0A1G8BDT6_9BACI|nr:flagellar motor protein MotS [Alteribacillus persepolensis]SDH31338.1 chemotaxis protein MotB [Alteribacillus persepolensis]